ncbi:MAG TPA: DbpA RNA binding domain-containing protein [Rectinemataceae bacterium]|nr:DbpA RNA binding domain-containing protein [Rectinemataceae bacterium]
MPTESAPNKIPEEALNAFLDGILEELRSPPDPAILTKVRSIFRKRIPLHMRSYAAALLILRAAGITRNQPQKTVAASAKALKESSPVKAPKPATAAEPAEKTRPAPSARQVRSEGESVESQGKPPIRKSVEGMVPLFVSMGKRQRLRPQELRTLISEKSGVTNDELGRVHLFDNYSFIDVPEIHAEKIIGACDGANFKNRTIEIKPAKKRGDQPEEKEQKE